MANEIRTIDNGVIASLVLNGDLKKLQPSQKVDYYRFRCQQAGLDPAAKPFDLLTLNGKEVLYANAACTQQLTQIHKLSHTVTNRELVDGIYCVFVRVTGPDGRSTENMGAVPVDALKGEAKANAMLKATTKAIRRAVLAHCGLGMLDETEVETIPGATKAAIDIAPEDPPVEWSDDDYKAAGEALLCIAEVLDAEGIPTDKIDAALAKAKNSIGDPSIPYDKWNNRVSMMSERMIQANKKEC